MNKLQKKEIEAIEKYIAYHSIRYRVEFDSDLNIRKGYYNFLIFYKTSGNKVTRCDVDLACKHIQHHCNNLIADIQPNGVDRVAIFYNKEALNA